MLPVGGPHDHDCRDCCAAPARRQIEPALGYDFRDFILLKNARTRVRDGEEVRKRPKDVVLGAGGPAAAAHDPLQHRDQLSVTASFAREPKIFLDQNEVIVPDDSTPSGRSTCP